MALLVGLALALPAGAVEVGGVKLDDKARVANADLALGGAGVRTRFVFEVYAIGLYLADPKADPVVQPGPKRIAIHMLREVDAGQFVDALKDGLKSNLAPAELKAIESRVAALAEMMGSVKSAAKGMRFSLDWIPASGTRVLLDGKPLGAAIPGEDFYGALLRIWLGEKPVQDDLKNALLGRK